jgi:hypothetical protein
MFGHASVTIDLDQSTQILRADGAPGTIDDLVSDQEVELSGIFNRTTMTMVQTAAIHILTAPTPQIVVDVAHQVTKMGQDQTVSIAAPSNSPVHVLVRFPDGEVRHKSLPTDALGRASYTFRVPAGVNSASSQQATIVVTGQVGSATNAFIVRRAPVEAYVAQSVVKAGHAQILTLLGPPGAWMTLQFLYSDGTYELRAIRLSPQGTAAYRFFAPAIATGIRRVAVQAVAALPSGTYLSTANFSVR